MKVLLLFPPEWLPTEPYLSLPMLTAVLRSAGHEVVQSDTNVLMYDMMLSAPFLRHIQKKKEQQITHGHGVPVALEPFAKRALFHRPPQTGQ